MFSNGFRSFKSGTVYTVHVDEHRKSEVVHPELAFFERIIKCLLDPAITHLSEFTTDIVTVNLQSKNSLVQLWH